MDKLKLHPICKHHKIKMELSHIEKGYRIWICPICELNKKENTSSI
jgi:hypothetical protein